jgi:hypothetical protein
LSHTPSHSGFTLTDNKFFYAGVAQGGMALGSTVVSHRWATEENMNGQTLCVEKQSKSMDPQDWNGWKFTPVEFAGVANSANILAACRFFRLPLLLLFACHPGLRSDLFSPHAGLLSFKLLAIIQATT